MGYNFDPIIMQEALALDRASRAYSDETIRTNGLWDEAGDIVREMLEQAYKAGWKACLKTGEPDHE
jgi:hypothetical protein